MQAFQLVALAIASLLGSPITQAETIVPDTSAQVTYQPGMKIVTQSIADHSIVTVNTASQKTLTMTLPDGIITKTCYKHSETKSTCVNTYIGNDGTIRSGKSNDILVK